MNRASCAMKATAASTAMIPQRFASPSSDASADTSLPPAAVLAGAVSAIALPHRPATVRGQRPAQETHRSVRHHELDLGSLTELPSQLITPSLVRSMNYWW